MAAKMAKKPAKPKHEAPPPFTPTVSVIKLDGAPAGSCLRVELRSDGFVTISDGETVIRLTGEVVTDEE